ncbi:MAG TPA: N-(5'-phosphoribosyl)anthranilate isomerase [Thermoanaerobaculia bacterium]|nr:N-(5'-phosphoribosyl)anthranilate isomerase [Thermoanaerobaculia bacterium]
MKVKICGVTSTEDALAAAAAGADLLGLNFYPPSPRALDAAKARAIADAVRAAAAGVLLVGVFADRPPYEVEAIDRAVGLDLLQLSGDEPAASVRPHAARTLKAFRTAGAPSEEALSSYPEIWGVLIDARHNSLYGGTGSAWDFASVAPLAARRRVLVAGGIRPGNVAAALASGAWGIDVCSGVESAPGVKDPRLLARLFEEVHG